jgi:glycolate oxidase iron-sulfur subunit
VQTRLTAEYKESADGREAEAILRKCVHCGFCNATCPTYQLLGDELDGPRGRIYLIKQLLEGGAATPSTQLHLDRCLTCRNCETTCPSGVEFGRLIDIGRQIVEAQVPRPARERAERWLLRTALTSRLFGVALRIGLMLRPLLPAVLAAKLPVPAGLAAKPPVPTGRAAPRPAPGAAAAGLAAAGHRKVLLLAGCVQPALAPNINAATLRVLAAAGIDGEIVRGAGCCGAIRSHLSDHDGGLDDARRNIDAWWPAVSAGDIDAIVSNASACALAIKDYGRALAADARYAERAARISALARDVSELLPLVGAALADRLQPQRAGSLVFHPPCTLQHGQKLGGRVESQLRALGFDVSLAAAESSLCCGSAGTYSVLQPMLAGQLRERKLHHLAATGASCIISANIGCINHLQSGTATPVRHWIEILDAALTES